MFIYRSTKQEDHYKYYIRGLLIKIFGGVAFALIYVYYYKFGDTFLYHRGAIVLSESLLSDPSDYFRLLFSTNNQIPPDLTEYAAQISFSRTYEEWFMVKLLSPLNMLGFNSYLTVTLFTSILSFWGAWKLFLVFRDLIPRYSKYAFYIVFLTPTVTFWGGGIMKDTFTLVAINLIIHHLYFGIFKGKFRIIDFLVIGIAGYIIIGLKAYVLLAFIPGITYALYLNFKDRINNRILKFILGPTILVALIGVSVYTVQTLSDSSLKYSSQNLEYQVRGFHSWHTDVGGSSYNLGQIEFTTTGILSKIPEALNVTFFRPYIWESSNVVVAITAVESLFVLVLFLIALFRTGYKFFKHMRKSPFVLGLFIYALIFGFAVGFTSYNFGALARYKIPVLSLFILVLAYIIISTKKELSDSTQ